jgi:hypothetical protein
MKRFISYSMAFILVASLFTLSAFATTTYVSVDVTLAQLGGNTKVASAKKTSSNTTYDSFKWTGGDVNTFNLWILNDAGNYVADKVSFPGGWIGDDKYHAISYRPNTTIVSDESAHMYGEQFNIFTKTLKGSAMFT